MISLEFTGVFVFSLFACFYFLFFNFFSGRGGILRTMENNSSDLGIKLQNTLRFVQYEFSVQI